MNKHTYVFLSSLIFFCVALFHVGRLLNNIPLVVGTWSVPPWASVVGLVVAGYLSYTGFMMGKKK